jgi:hypothetical protein
MIPITQDVKHVVEAGAPIVAVGTLAGWLVDLLPSIAAGMSILWLWMQMIMNWEKIYIEAKRLWSKLFGGRH